MWLNFSDIPHEGLQLQLEESPSDLDLEVNGVKVSGQIEFKGRLNKLDKDVLVRGDLRTRVVVACARCLEPCTLPVSAHVELEYRLKEKEPQEEEIEVVEEDINVYFYTKNRIDLSTAFRDQILLAIPLKPLCGDDCKGICPGCGANLNRGACMCREHQVDPRLEVLRSLKRDGVKES